MKAKSCIKPSFILHEFLFVFLGVSISFFVFNSPVNAEINCEQLVNQSTQENAEEKYKKGYCYIKLGKFKEGAELLNGLEKELGIIGDYVLYYRGYGARISGNLSGASDNFRRISTEYPESALRKKALIRLAEVYSDIGDHGKAESLFRTLYSDESDSWMKSSFLNNIGESLERQKRYAEAINIYEQLWTEFPESEFAGGAFDKALQISKKEKLPFLPGESDYLKRAERLFALSKWDSTLRNFDRVTQTAEVKTKVAVCKFYLGRLDEALAILAPIKSPESLYWTAKIKTKLGKDDEASETYYRIYLLYPDSPLAAEGLYNGGRLYQINKNPDNALKLYDLLIRKYPGSEFYEDGAWNLGWIYYKTGKYREALATFSAFASSSSDFNSSRATYWKAKTLEKQGQKKEASGIYENLSRNASPSYYSYLAQKKTGFTPDVRASEFSEADAVNGAKAEFLIELGILEDAVFEVKKLEEKAKSPSEFIAVSKLYAGINDFYSSIRVAQGVGLPAANRLSYPEGFGETVKAFAAKYGVDEFMVYSIMREESRFQTDAVSPAEAVGLMQLIPSTGRSMAREVGIGGYNTDMLYIPRINIELGVAYFKKVLEEFDGVVHLALASYNAGPGNVADWTVRFPNLELDEFVEEIPFSETKNYVRRILRSYGAYKAIYRDRHPGLKSEASQTESEG